MAPEESDTGQGEPALPCRLPYSMTLLGKASQIPAAFRRQKPAALPCMKPWKKVQEMLMKQSERGFSCTEIHKSWRECTQECLASNNRLEDSLGNRKIDSLNARQNQIFQVQVPISPQVGCLRSINKTAEKELYSIIPPAQPTSCFQGPNQLLRNFASLKRLNLVLRILMNSHIHGNCLPFLV